MFDFEFSMKLCNDTDGGRSV